MTQPIFSDQPAPEDAGLFSDQPAPEDISRLESFSRGTLNNLPLGPQVGAALAPINPYSEKPTYSEELAHLTEAAQQAKKANPKTYGAGAVTGAVAPMFIPGVGAGLKAAPFAGSALYGAASSISNTDLLKQPGEAAKEAAIGAGIGLGTAGLVKGLTPNAATLENMANKSALKSINMPAGELVDMSEPERWGLAQFLREHGMVGADKPKALENARNLLNQYGEKIGELGEKSETLGLRVTPDEHYKVVQNLLAKSEQFGGLENREARALARNYKAGANDILNLPDPPSWTDIQRLKDQYGGLAFKSTGEVKDEAAKDTYFALKDMLKGIADKAHSDPNMPAQYKMALAGYSRMHPVVNGLEKSVDAELRGGGPSGGHSLIGLIKKMPGPLRATIGGIGALTGHPHYAMAAALPELTNPAIHSNIAGAAARNLPGIRQGMNQELADFLTSKYGANQ